MGSPQIIYDSISIRYDHTLQLIIQRSSFKMYFNKNARREIPSSRNLSQKRVFKRVLNYEQIMIGYRIAVLGCNFLKHNRMLRIIEKNYWISDRNCLRDGMSCGKASVVGTNIYHKVIIAGALIPLIPLYTIHQCIDQNVDTHL